MANASLVLPFLPLTAGQILLNNFLTDIPAVGIADDSVDPELSIRFTPDGRNLVRPSAGALKILHSWRPPRVAQQHVSRQELVM